MSHEEGEEAADTLRVVHHHAGRLRLRSDTFLDGNVRAEAAREALAVAPGVLSIGHEEGTGSLLIEYDPALITAESLLGLVARGSRLRAAGSPKAPDRSQGQRILDLCRDLNASAYELTGFRIDLRTVVPVTLACLSGAALLFGKGSRLPRWDSLAYWSVNLFAMFHPRGAERPPEPRRPPEQSPR